MDDLKKKLLQPKTRITPEQLQILEEFYKNIQHPSMVLKNKIAKQLGLSRKYVDIWFQNRRAKAKRTGSEKSDASGSPPDSPPNSPGDLSDSDPTPTTESPPQKKAAQTLQVTRSKLPARESHPNSAPPSSSDPTLSSITSASIQNPSTRAANSNITLNPQVSRNHVPTTANMISLAQTSTNPLIFTPTRTAASLTHAMSVPPPSYRPVRGGEPQIAAFQSMSPFISTMHPIPPAMIPQPAAGAGPLLYSTAPNLYSSLLTPQHQMFPPFSPLNIPVPHSPLTHPATIPQPHNQPAESKSSHTINSSSSSSPSCSSSPSISSNPPSSSSSSSPPSPPSSPSSLAPSSASVEKVKIRNLLNEEGEDSTYIM